MILSSGVNEIRHHKLSKLNCEVLHDDLAYEVRWAVAGDSIVLQLVAKLENREYMSFGISGEDEHSAMVGGDVVVAWVDKETLKGFAEDYFLDAKSQCSGPTGSCPDNHLSDNTNNIRLLNAAMVNGYSIVTYQRPLRPSDQFDRRILTNQSQPVIWAIGPLNQKDEVSFHSQYNKRDKFIHFGRQAKWNCPMPEGDQPTMKVAMSSPPGQKQPQRQQHVVEENEDVEIVEPVRATTTTRPRNPDHRRRGGQNRNRGGQEQDSSSSTNSANTAVRNPNQRRRPAAPTTTTTTTTSTARPQATPAPTRNRASAWHIPPIQCNEPEDGVFYAQMGPTGGKHGYPAITGHVGWGISWYINGLLIPEINVVRGKQYTFVVEGGYDPEIPAKYHPFYITDDPVGGFEYKTPEERANVQIFAGVRQGQGNTIIPTGVGRLCHWTHQGDSDADDFDSFGAYQRTLELKCDQGEPGVIQWTPDKNTPDTVYYQCFTHRYLGWKINVLDSCDHQGASSEQQDVIVDPSVSDADLEDSPSIRIETKVKPNGLEADEDNKLLDLAIEGKPGLVKDYNSSNVAVVFYQELPRASVLIPFDENKIHANITMGKTHKPYFNHPGKVVYRRPTQQHYNNMPPPPPRFVKHTMRPPMNHRPPMALPGHMMKKPFFRANPIKLPPPNMRPMNMMQHPSNKHDKPFMMPSRAVPIKPQFLKQKQSEDTDQIKNIEISPEQRATEQTPIQSKSTEELDYTQMRPAINTGFKPDTVVMENGFLPIMNKEIESRMAVDEDEELPDIQFESEIGVIDEEDEKLSVNKDDLKATDYFGPMFIPSPTIGLDNANLKTRSDGSDQMEREASEDDAVAEAAERVESYYLPPDNKHSKPVERTMQKSNIDIPPGTVVTYDGRKVSGASLTVRMPEQRSNVFESRSSKAAELIRAQPQFLPFQGELPPIDLTYAKQASQVQGRGFINRGLDTPDPPVIAGGSTKLLPVRH